MPDRLKRYLGGMTWPIIVAMVALMAVSLLAIHAAEQADPIALAGKTFRQGQYVAVALVAFLSATLVSFRRIGRWAYFCFAVNLVLLVLVFFVRPIKGSHRWFDLRLFSFQPSELAKITYILSLAWYLRYRANYRRLGGLIPPFVLTLIPAVLILAEPDLGTTLLLFPVLLVMLFMAGARLRHLLAVLAVAAAVMLLPVPQSLQGLSEDSAAQREALAYWRGEVAGKPYVVRAAPLLIMRAHQLRRIEGWLRQGDEAVAQDEGYQLQQSMMILGAGGLTGKARAEAMRLYFRMLPDDHTDFIFAVIGGRGGFIGCVGVMLLYLVIFICGAEIAALTHDAFGRLLAIGVLALLFAQIMINVGMTMGLTPITGMTLPLVSYGGSSMVVNGIALGLLVNVGQRRPVLLGRKPFDHDGKAPEAAADVSTPPPRPKT